MLAFERKLNSISYRIVSYWFGLFTRQSRRVQLHSRALRLYRATKSRDKIAGGVTSVLVEPTMLIVAADL